MKNLKKKKLLLMFVLFIALTTMLGTLVYAQTIKLEKDVIQSTMGPTPFNVTFTIYDAQTGGTQLATQTFNRSQWKADYSFKTFPGESTFF